MNRPPEAPDPLLIREATLEDVAELGFPLPPPTYPLVWEQGDRVALRPQREIEARAAVLNAVLAATFGAPSEATAGWLERNGLRPHVTEAEWAFVADGKGDSDVFGLHIEALWALAWLLGVADELDPSQYCGDGLASWLPNLADDESFGDWRVRSDSRLRPAEEAALLLDLHYCLDWGHIQAIVNGRPHPGATQPYVVGQRRWSLEWAVVFTGPYHEPPLAWDEVDLTS